MVVFGEFPLFLFGVNSAQMMVLLQGDVAEQIRHGLAVVSSANGLCKDHGNVYNLEKNRKTLLHPLCKKNKQKKTH